MNNEIFSERTTWTDEYTTALFSICSLDSNRKGLQPIPDIPRWLKFIELHYMPLQEAACLEHGPWDEIPPIKNIRLVQGQLLPDIAHLIALLAWTTPDETKEYYTKLETKDFNT